MRAKLVSLLAPLLVPLIVTQLGGCPAPSPDADRPEAPAESGTPPVPREEPASEDAPPTDAPPTDAQPTDAQPTDAQPTDAPPTGRAPQGRSGADAPAPGAPESASVVADWTIAVPSRSRTDMDPAVMKELRFGRHATYDRVVLEFRDALPGWHLEYVDHPVRDCGPGRVVPLEGDAHLLIRMSPAVGHTEAGEATVETRYDPDLANVIEAARTCDFEGQLTFVLGLRSPTPFRVLELEQPPRLVVDVRLPERLRSAD